MPFTTFNEIYLNKVYSFSIKSTIFNAEYEEEIFEGWRNNAKYATEYGEIIITKVFPKLIRRPANDSYDFDYKIKNDSIRVEMKCFGKNGCKILPSNQLGVGRKKDQEEFEYRIKKSIYLICDITNTPKLRVIFYKGEDLYKLYPSGTIKSKDKASIFIDDAEPLLISKVFGTYRNYTETENEEYYTKSHIAKKCIDFIDNIEQYDVIVEPSAGNGSFSTQLVGLPKVLSFDINPQCPNILEQDFLELDTFDLLNKKVLTIGNPPFGRQSSIAKKFIRKAKCYSDTIAFILPRSFKKDSMQKVFEGFTLEKWFDIEENAFLIKGSIEHNVPCIFQVWKRNNKPIISPIKKILPINYKFIPKSHLDIDFNDNNMLFIHRAGSKAGLAFTEKEKIINEKDKIKDGYYIIESNFIKNNKKYLIKEINNIKWEHKNTIGQKSISQSEIIPYLNNFFNAFS